jgi:putative membrane protein
VLKRVCQIFREDLLSVGTNWAAAAIIMALIVLPSLYAWFNIEASWDPYGNTKGIPIAVVNNDTGAVLKGMKINIGRDVVQALRKNKSLGWRFVDSAEADRGVKQGKYFASITIPKDFSPKIATILSDNPKKPELIYTVNEKINAIAPKITVKGAEGLQDEISKNFVKTASNVIFTIFNQLGVELQRNLPDIEKLKTMIFWLNDHLGEAETIINTADQDSAQAQKIVEDLQRYVAEVQGIIDKARGLSGQVTSFFDKNKEAFSNLGPAIKQNLLYMQQNATSIEQLTGVLLSTTASPEDKKNALNDSITRLNILIEMDTLLINLFDHLNGLGDTSVFSQQLASITKEKTASENLLHMLTTIQFQAVPSQALVQQANETSKAVTSGLTQLTSKYDTLALIKRDYPGVKQKIANLANQIRQFEKTANIQEIIDLLRNNAMKESDYFAKPVLIKEKRLFPIPNYGSAMSPFYTTLSLWVGTTLLISLIPVEILQNNFSPNQVYLGRFLTFLIFALCQSIIVTLGDVFLLKTYVAAKLWFVLFGLLISAIFMLITYTLVSIFGNVGKGLAIVLLVLQVSGSGGTFPIQVMPPFFQRLNPLLPFTYAISLIRESVGGIQWDVAKRDLAISFLSC